MARSNLFRLRDDGNYDYVQIDHNNNGAETILSVMTPAEKESFGRPSEDEMAATSRSMRDAYLGMTDWWCVSDRTPTQEQLDYRQALRDLPSHANWPYLEASDWPDRPE